jgi:GT2 family glycosyltransferase
MPSVLRAARSSRYRCDVAVVDNASTDDSLAVLAGQFPDVRVIRRPNRGLCSFNDVVPELPGPVAMLLNNDIKLHPDCIDPWLAPLLEPQRGSACFMTAPLCYRFDGVSYEGFRTAAEWRWGLVQATAIFPGCERIAAWPGLTASAGAALAVDRRKFSELGGFDPLYLPGRLEDLDFAFRGYMAGYQARYVPTAVAYHLGMGTFGPAFGRAACDRLALRNTLLFQWKNIRHPLHLGRQLLGLPLRLLLDVYRAPWTGRSQRWAFLRALAGALARVGQLRHTAYAARPDLRRERLFFLRFHPRRLLRAAAIAARQSRPRIDGCAVQPAASAQHDVQGVAR